MPQVFSLKDVKNHKTKNSCWIVVHNKVYDVTSFLHEHPGGEMNLLDHAGGNATSAFENIGHSQDAREILKDYFIGDLRKSDWECFPSVKPPELSDCTLCNWNQPQPPPQSPSPPMIAEDDNQQIAVCNLTDEPCNSNKRCVCPRSKSSYDETSPPSYSSVEDRYRKCKICGLRIYPDLADSAMAVHGSFQEASTGQPSDQASSGQQPNHLGRPFEPSLDGQPPFESPSPSSAGNNDEPPVDPFINQRVDTTSSSGAPSAGKTSDYSGELSQKKTNNSQQFGQFKAKTTVPCRVISTDKSTKSITEKKVDLSMTSTAAGAAASSYQFSDYAMILIPIGILALATVVCCLRTAKKN